MAMMPMYTYGSTQPALNYYNAGGTSPYGSFLQNQWSSWGQPQQTTAYTPNYSQFQSAYTPSTNAAQQFQGAYGSQDALGLGQFAMGMAKDIVAITQMGRETPQQHMERRKWERFREPAHNVFQSQFYNPNMAGLPVPYSGGQNYQWSPSPAMQGVYSNYLNRQYGLPESIARAQAAQAMQPTRLGRLPQESASPAAMSAALSQHAGRQAQTMGQAQIGQAMPALSRQLDYLQNAAQLAAFNLQRAQTLPQIIG